MKIEAGKYYRMRCGGAVRIEYVDNDATTGPHSSLKEDYSWYRGGVAFPDEVHPFDLVAEITEAEYSRIVSGERPDDSAYEAYLQSDAAKQIEALKAENEGLKTQLENCKRLFRDVEQKLNDEEAEYKKRQRFEAAKATMQGMLSNADLDVLQDAEWIAKHARAHADALIKALEETK